MRISDGTPDLITLGASSSRIDTSVLERISPGESEPLTNDHNISGIIGYGHFGLLANKWQVSGGEQRLYDSV